VRLTPKTETFERSQAVVKLSLEGKPFEIPIEVRPALAITPLAPGAAPADAARKIGALAPRDDSRATASGEVFAAWSGDSLAIKIRVSDDEAVRDSDRLMLGVALENSDPVYEVWIHDGAEGPVIERNAAESDAPLAAWTVHVEGAPSADSRTWSVSVPASAFDVERLAADQHALIAVRYVDVDGPRKPHTVLEWGRGLQGSQSSTGYNWVRLRGE
jgi:hypothetical protein